MDHEGETFKDLNDYSNESEGEGEYNDYSQDSEAADDYSEEEKMDNNDAQVDDLHIVTENEEATTSAPQANRRGLTWLAKWRAKFQKNGGEKWPLTFDAVGRIGGEHRPKFSSFMGDIVRSEVGLRYLQWRKVPKEDKDTMWAGIQKLFNIDDCRRGAIMVQNKELAADDIPSRAFMWRKARVNKEGEYKTPVVKGVEDEIAENETKINAGSVTVEPGTDALTLVLGKERGGYLKGIGYGVTSRGYWQGAPKGRSKERIEKLESELKNERQLREKKDQEVEHLNDKIKAHDEKIDMLTTFMNDMIKEKQLSVVDKAVNSLKSADAPLNTTVRSKNSCNEHSNVNTTDMINSAHNTSRKQSPQSNSSQRSADKVCSATGSQHTPPSTTASGQKERGKKRQRTEAAAAATSTAGASQQEVGCKTVMLHLGTPRNIVAKAELFPALKDEMIHGVPLPSNCRRVSISEVLKEHGFLPHPVEGLTTIKELAEKKSKYIIAWPKDQMINADHDKRLESKVCSIDNTVTVLEEPKVITILIVSTELIN
ncbi:hypothetical protein SSX86_006604 [Deinandra increscens subsp. villosa]|uniref:DUF8039 domain-containing protein n=1 Tax=Deinandra increscens subsp. villosa TaxID=3103831 RepID=A0AAP0H5U0_9ASTR